MSTAAVIKLVFFYSALLWCVLGSVIALVGWLRGGGQRAA
jgi:hypothetical protein